MKMSLWSLRVFAGSAMALAVACGVAMDTRGNDALGAASAEPAPPAAAQKAEPQAGAATAKNTGKRAGPGFLIDLSKGRDDSTQYLANYDLNAGWVKSAFKEANIKFGKDGMTLVSKRERSGDQYYTSAEFQRQGFYGYGRYEAVLRATDTPGVVSSFFTHTDSYFDDPHDEVDFEFVGRMPKAVHTNYFHDNDGDALDIPLWFDTSAGEHLYAFEWSPDFVRWYVDGVKIREVVKANAKGGIPTASGRVIANLWAGTGPVDEWTGQPHYDRTEAFYRCISHVPMGQKGPQCSDTFKAPPKP